MKGITYNNGLSRCARPSYTQYQRGCRCEACKADAKRWSEAIKRGEKYRTLEWHDAQEVRDAIDALTEKGYSRSSICRAAGVGNSTVNNLYDRKTYRIREDIAQRILAVKESDVEKNGWEMVETQKAAQAIRALRKLGCPLEEIAEAAGIAYDTAFYISSGKRKKSKAHTVWKIEKAVKTLAPKYMARARRA